MIKFHPKTACLALASLLALGLTPAWAQDRTYSVSGLKREQEKFKAYLASATNELSAAKARLDANGDCELSVKATCIAYSYITLSAKNQEGHLDRIEKNDGTFPVMEARTLNGRYQDIIKLQNTTEDAANNFVEHILKKSCPDYVSFIQAFVGHVKNINTSDPNWEQKLRQEIDKMDNSNPLTAKNRIDFLTADPEQLIKNLVQAGLTPDTAKQVSDAFQNHQWQKLLNLLKDCDDPICQEMKKYAADQLKKSGGGGDAGNGNGADNGTGNGNNTTTGNGTGTGNGNSTTTGTGTGTGTGMGNGNSGDQTGKKPVASEPEPTEETLTGSFDMGGGRSGSAVAIYPNGKAKGILSEERWTITDSSGATTKETHAWEFVIDAEQQGGNKESFTVSNESDNKQEFAVESWSLLKDGTSVQSGSGAKFDVTYSDAGNYEVVAKGKTKPTSFPFTVRKTRTYNP
jgi:hypothetical protein